MRSSSLAPLRGIRPLGSAQITEQTGDASDRVVSFLSTIWNLYRIRQMPNRFSAIVSSRFHALGEKTKCNVHCGPVLR